ncbi:MAG: FUSC family protein [Romboutsia sp.]|uniref:FUSC family protein n=1 Tax=Romboutsia sp. TaxID=1965302 RepID=UPI003F3B78DA
MKSINKDFLTKTLTFIVNSIFINVFAKVFGMSNTMIAVSIVVIALTLVSIDLKEDIFIKVLWISISLIILGSSASIALLNPILGLVVNLIIIFFIVYYTMDNYKSPMYFPFILSYIFMLMSSPATIEMLPLRLLSIVIGSGYILLIQLVLNKNRFSKTVIGTRKGIIFSILQQIDNIIDGNYNNNLNSNVNNLVNTKVKAIYDTRLKYKYITHKNIGNLEVCLSLQNLNKSLAVFKDKKELNTEERKFLLEIKKVMILSDKYFHGQEESISIEQIDYHINKIIKDTKNKNLINIIKTIKDFKNYLKLRKQEDSDIIDKKEILLFNALKKIDIKSVSFKFASKLSISISLVIFLVTILDLKYGRWIIFPMISIIQPYYDFTAKKAFNRVGGTLLGIIMFTIIFTIVKDNTLRLNITILSAYINVFITKYQYSTAIVAISALGSAAMSGGGIEILFNRILFTIIGCGAAMLINKYILHYKISDSIKDLTTEYELNLKKIEAMSKKKEDEVKRYNLILNTKLMEYKIGLYQDER